MKFVYQRQQGGMTLIIDAQGNLLTRNADIVARWKQYLSNLLNQPGTANVRVLDEISQEELISKFEIPPTVEDVELAIDHTANNKAPRPTEVLKVGGPALPRELQDLLLSGIWQTERYHLQEAMW